MPRRKEFGLFKLDVNADVVLVFKGTVGEINRWAKGKGLAFRRDAKNIFGGYWVDETTGDAYGVDIIGGRRGQARNPSVERGGTGADAEANWQEYWRDHGLTAAKIYRDIRKRHPDSDEEMIEEETANVLMGLHDSPIRTAIFDENIASDLAWVARHTVERPKEFGTQNPVEDPQSVLEFAQDVMARKRSEGRSIAERFALAEIGFGIAVTSARKVGAKRIKYISISPTASDKFQITGYAGSDARLRLLGYPKNIFTNNVNEAANYLSTIYAIRHAPGARR